MKKAPYGAFFILVFIVIVNEAGRVNNLRCACGGMLPNRKQLLVREAAAAYFQANEQKENRDLSLCFLF